MRRVRKERRKRRFDIGRSVFGFVRMDADTREQPVLLAHCKARSLSARSHPTVMSDSIPASRARCSTASRSSSNALSCTCAWVSIMRLQPPGCALAFGFIQTPVGAFHQGFDRIGRVAVAMPMLAVTGLPPACVKPESSIAARSRSPMTQRDIAPASGMSTMNSSPPIRPARSHAANVICDHEADELQTAIAGLMPEPIVDRFEEIDIQNDDRARAARPAGLRVLGANVSRIVVRFARPVSGRWTPRFVSRRSNGNRAEWSEGGGRGFELLAVDLLLGAGRPMDRQNAEQASHLIARGKCNHDVFARTGDRDAAVAFDQAARCMAAHLHRRVVGRRSDAGNGLPPPLVLPPYRTICSVSLMSSECTEERIELIWGSGSRAPSMACTASRRGSTGGRRGADRAARAGLPAKRTSGSSVAIPGRVRRAGISACKHNPIRFAPRRTATSCRRPVVRAKVFRAAFPSAAT